MRSKCEMWNKINTLYLHKKAKCNVLIMEFKKSTRTSTGMLEHLWLDDGGAILIQLIQMGNIGDETCYSLMSTGTNMCHKPITYHITITLNIRRYRGRNLIWAVNVVWAWMKPVRGSISRWCRSSFGTLNCNFNALVALKAQKKTHCRQLCVLIAGKYLHCWCSHVTMTEQITTWQQQSASQPVLPSTPRLTVSKLSTAFCKLLPATSYLAAASTHMAVRRFSPVRRSGTRCLTSS